MLDFESANNLLSYDPASGIFHWKIDRGDRIKAGTKAGYQNPSGYILIKTGDRNYKAHRLAWLLSTGKWPSGEMDHINRDKADNRLSNLRLASRSINMKNRGLPRNNSSGVVGVVWRQKNQRWIAQIKSELDYVYLGCFDNLLDSVCARKSAEIKFKFP